VLKALNGVKQPAVRKGKKRSRKTLRDRTNLQAQDQNESKIKKIKVANDEDKENIPPEESEAVVLASQETVPPLDESEAPSLASHEAAAVIITKETAKGEQFELIFPSDIKRSEKDGHLLPIEYKPDLTLTMFSNERKSADLFPDPNYFQRQTDIQQWMRTKLYTWLSEVHLEFKLREVVLWASFQICDRFLSKVDIPREKLQLVGCTSMWIACKYHEVNPPMAADMINISDNHFTNPDLLTMEVRICDNLSFQFSLPNALHFLERFTEVAIESVQELRLKNRVKWLARYGMERFHLNVKSLQYCPSMLAAGALYAALILTSHSWTKPCVVVSGYSVKQLQQGPKDRSIFYQIKKIIMNFGCTSHKAVIRKYSASNRGSVSMLRRKRKSSSA